MNPINSFLKRLLDLVGATIALILLSPVLLISAILVKLDSPGPALFLQERVGYKGKLFTIYKFRTMKTRTETRETDSETDPEKIGKAFEILENDPAITRTGAFLRRWSIDELPQIFNVLKGDMSLVGPRPTLKYQVDRYDEHQIRRLETKPGITGLASVMGRNLLTWNRRIEYDIWYIDNYSIFLDLKIILKTIKVVLIGEGLYAPTKEIFKVTSDNNTKTPSAD